MNCWHCRTELIWGGDIDVEDIVLGDMIHSNLSCPNKDCRAKYEVYLPLTKGDIEHDR
tara:strand:+ start:564 stop:737 length:174 start_codon:yes stop_codon:yes gene_type:complete